MGASVAACGSGTQAKATRDVAEPPSRPAAAPAAAAPKPPSAYEKRWQDACANPETAGRCPAPFDRPGVLFDVNGSGDYAPPSLCDVGDRATEAATVAALQPKRKALRACLRGAARGAWVDLVSDGSRPASASADVPARSSECVAKIVRRALPSEGPASVKRVVVLNAGGAGEGEPLSKDRITEMITAHADEVSACYDGALEVWPGLRGRHTPRVVIWFDGSVVLVRTQKSTLHNPALECCINTRVRDWRFGAPEDGNIVIVSLPFVLGPPE
jgi:hypothetical protein